MCAHDLAIKFRRRIDVVIVGGHTGGFELTRFCRADLAECDAHFHAEPADFAHDLEHALKFFGALAHATPCRAHAKAGRALRPRPFGNIDNALDRQ